MLGREHAVKVELGLATELMSDHRFDAPLSWENAFVAILELLERALEPGEAALGVVEAGVRLACKD